MRDVNQLRPRMCARRVEKNMSLQSDQSEKPVEYSASDVTKMQRTERGLAFERKCNALRERTRAKDPKALETLRQVKDFLRDLKEPGMRVKAGGGILPGAVHSNTFMSNFSLQYANDEYIGERCMPIVPVVHRSDAFATYGKRDRLAAPDDTIGPRGVVNEVNETRSSDNYSVKDRALQAHIDATTIQNEDAVFDEMFDLLAAPNDGLALKREIRIAAAVQLSTNYSGNTTTLSGANQWDSAAGGDPLKNIQTAVASLWGGMGATNIVGVCNLDVFNVLTRHPQLLDLLKYTAAGVATRQQLANIFGLSEILVGAARTDTANSGQTASYSRIWTDSFSVLRVAQRPTKRSAHFGSTFRLNGDPKTTAWFEEAQGKEGCYYAKVGVSEDHKIVAGDSGALIIDCLA
jgi:hypothetical protein